jgi:hypothetical protein
MDCFRHVADVACLELHQPLGLQVDEELQMLLVMAHRDLLVPLVMLALVLLPK